MINDRCANQLICQIFRLSKHRIRILFFFPLLTRRIGWNEACVGAYSQNTWKSKHKLIKILKQPAQHYIISINDKLKILNSAFTKNMGCKKSIKKKLEQKKTNKKKTQKQTKTNKPTQAIRAVYL